MKHTSSCSIKVKIFDVDCLKLTKKGMEKLIDQNLYLDKRELNYKFLIVRVTNSEGCCRLSLTLKSPD